MKSRRTTKATKKGIRVTVTEILRSVHFVVDLDGKPTAAQLDIEAWEQLVDFIRDVAGQSPGQAVSGPMQGQKLEDLWGDFWPADESVDDFIETVRQWRREDLTLHEDVS